MSIVTCATAGCSGVSWLTGPSRPVVATNELMPSSSGTPAAMAAPNASRRRIERAAHGELLLTSPRRRAPWDRGRAAATRRRAPARAARDAPSGPRPPRPAGPRPASRASPCPGGLDLGGQRERHEDGAAVLGDRVRAVLRVERALDVGDALEVAEAADHVLDGGGDLRRIGLDRALALHEHALADRVGEAGVVDDHRAALGLAVAGCSRLEVLLTDVAADHRGEDDEEDPSEDGGLAVRGTPSACACREISGLHGWSLPAPTSPPQGVARRLRGGHQGRLLRGSP